MKEAIEPLERKLDNLNNGFQELKRLVDFVNDKYDDILAQLKQANEKIQRQGTSLRQIRKDLDDARKEAQDAMNGFENLAEYLRRDCLEISGVPPSESYTCNQLVMAVRQTISVQVKEEDISTSHPLPTFREDAPPKIIVKFREGTRGIASIQTEGSLLTRKLVTSLILVSLQKAKYIYPNP